MSFGEQRAQAIRRINAMLEQLPPEHHPAMSRAWDELLIPLEEMRETEALAHISRWVEEMEERLAPSLVHSPLNEVQS